jgi:peptide/nickel transport system substrate-binding protein
MKRPRRLAAAACAGVFVLLTYGLVGCAGTGTTSAAASGTAIVHGGTLHVLEESDFGGAWTSLDPNTTNIFEYDYLNAIYGDLFEQNQNGGIIPDLAQSYSLTDGDRTLTIHLRPNVKFTDGTPFNAAAVVYNIKRDLEPKYACQCDTEMPVSSITTPNSLTVVMQLSRPYAPIVEAFIGAAPDWIASPTALQKEGATQFALHPVGAGPFTVVTNNPGVQLVLKKNPDYWEAGHPYLNELVFTPIGTDASAIEALYSGDDQVYEIFSSAFSEIPSIRAHGYKIYENPQITTLGALLNSMSGPLSNLTAREALSYATDPGPIMQSLFSGIIAPTEAPTGVLATDFPEPTVPGYRTYDPAKAEALVKQLGGLSVTISTYLGATGLVETAEALQAQWAKVGIKATIDQESDGTVVQDFANHSWEIFVAGVGNETDPALTGGLSTFYATGGSQSGTNNPTMDKLLAEGAATASPAARQQIYDQVYHLVAADSLAIVMGDEGHVNMTAPDVGGFTLWQETPFEDVYLTQS